MKSLNTLAMSAVLAAGCGPDAMSVGGTLDHTINPNECFDMIDGHRFNLKDQVTVITNPDERDVDVDSNGKLTDTYHLVREDLLSDLVILSAVKNLGGDNSTTRYGDAVTGTLEQNFGSGTVSTATTDLFTTVDFEGVIPSLANTEVDVVGTNRTCTKIYSDVFAYGIEDQRGEDENEPFYVAEEM